jgi:uncharacterized lipoprotein
MQEYSMNSTSRLSRSLIIGAVIMALVSTSGCHWAKRKFSNKNDYSQSPESRPLEVPPDLSTPNTSNALSIPPASSLSSSGQPTGEGGITVAGTSSANWPRVGAILETTDGVVINGRAEALSSFDVGYQGQDFLIRIEDVSGQSHIIAISSNGNILRAGPASTLLAILKSKL